MALEHSGNPVRIVYASGEASAFSIIIYAYNQCFSHIGAHKPSMNAVKLAAVQSFTTMPAMVLVSAE